MLKKYKKVTDAFRYQPGVPGSRLAELDRWLSGWSRHLVEGWNTGTNELTIDGQIVHPGDYVIRNMKDYPHVIAKADFEATYTRDSVKDFGDVNDPNLVDAPSTGLDIGFAVRWMREGRKVQRQGWNGKGMWIVMMPVLDLPPFNDQTTNRKVNDRTAKHIGEATPFHSNPYIAMWNARGEWQPGWVCSQEDLLATDWQVVD